MLPVTRKARSGKAAAIGTLLLATAFVGLHIFLTIPQDLLSSYSNTSVQTSLVDFLSPESTLRKFNVTNDPNDAYPIVVLPYHGPVDPYYNIPSDGTNLWDNNPHIPEWAKAYLNWHKWRRKTWNPDRWADDRWMIMQCLADQDKLRCGGTADRLKPIPTLLRIAYDHRRMLLIRWTRPAPLETFLVPPVGGVDWRVPEWMALVMANATNGRRFVPGKIIQQYARTNLTLMRTRYQSTNAGSDRYDATVREGELSFNEAFSHIWKLFFRPSPPVAQALQREMNRMQLVPGAYVSAHVRALYAIAERPLSHIRQYTVEVLDCASTLRPGAPIFFSSDSADASEFAREYVTSKGGRIETHTPNPNPPLHLDKDKNWKSRQPSEFYDTFVDLYIIALGGCVTLSTGGYGHWGLLIGGNVECSIERKFNAPGKCQWQDSPNQSVPNQAISIASMFPDAMI